MITMENYKRDTGSTVTIELRVDIESLKPDETEWQRFTTGRYREPSDWPDTQEDALRFIVERLQPKYPGREWRVITYERKVTRHEPYHPAFIRSKAEHPEAWSK